MNYFQAPDQINYSDLNSRECLFLAGSISNAKNWQKSIVEIPHRGLRLNDLFHVFNPRREDCNSLDPSVELEQISWEYRAIHNSDKMLFWFSNETLAPIALFELGSALNTHNHDDIFIGIDPEYQRKNDILIQTCLRNPELGEKIVFSQDELVERIIESTL